MNKVTNLKISSHSIYNIFTAMSKRVCIIKPMTNQDYNSY